MEICFTKRKLLILRFKSKRNWSINYLNKLYFAGDYTKPKGRVFMACESGLDVASIIN